MKPTSRRLVDLGERRIISDLLRPRYNRVLNFGDDAARLAPVPDSPGILVATTDPCPPPMAEELGARDQFYAGWLLATLNLSDLAAAGAEPIGLLTSLILPADMTIVDFERLLDGIDGCCATVGTQVVGGNLKEGKTRDLSATAIGFCPGREPLGRKGGVPGDRVVVLGELGNFWAGVLAVRQGEIAIDSGNALLRNVLTPLPKNTLMAEVASRGLVSTAIDNSDGLYPSMAQLAAACDCAVLLRSEQFCFEDQVIEMAAKLKIDPLRLALGWGDWQVITCCAPEEFQPLAELAGSHELLACAIGELQPGAGVLLEHEDVIGPLMPLDSQRFTLDSWFTAGLEGYIEMLLHAPLLAGT
jgi:thiamine-monophosphate kinase